MIESQPDRPGYRLHRLEVFNWGTFDSTDGTVFRFEPQGRTALLVGHNGSGKSTLVDAILTLLVDSRTRNYNVAAGAKKTERTPKSYIKGAFDRTSDESQSSVVKYLRPKGHHMTAISAVFRDEQLRRAFTLTQVLYLKADGSDDKIYAMADDPHELKEDLKGLQKADEVRDHLKSCGYRTTRAYVEYQGWLKKCTNMRGKAIDMFNQTVAVKDIQSLNSFIRRHMLEAHDWRDKVQRLLSHFADLSIAHQELVRARRALELLVPVEEAGTKYRKRQQEMTQWDDELAAAQTYFPVRLMELFDPEMQRQQQKVEANQAVIERLTRELRETRESIRQLKNEIESAGGARLKQIPDLINIEQAHLQHKRIEFDRYHANLRSCGINDVVGNPADFQTVNDRVQSILQSSEASIAKFKRQYEEAIGRKASIDRELRDETSEWEVLRNRRTNLPSRFSAMRSRICADLQLDESVLPFAAELISVLPAEQLWEASAEMVLRSFALSLLVPAMYYPRVRTYVERNRMTDAHDKGACLDYICVGRAAEPDGDRIQEHSLYHKLQFKPRHELSPWVRGEILRRFDFRCCADIEEFNDVPRLALTENRHVKFSNERHQKDDRARTVDPRHFVLGWDNTAKLRRIKARILELDSKRQEIEQSAASFGRQIQDLQNVVQSGQAALAVADFDAVDINRHQQEIVALQTERQQLEESNDAVKSLKTRLTSAEQREIELDAQCRSDEKQVTKRQVEIERVGKLLDAARADVQARKDAGEFVEHQALFAAITDSLAAPALTVENFFVRQKEWENQTRQRIDKLRAPLRDQMEKLINVMSRYLREFKEETDDLDASVDSLDSFVGVLDQLRQEDLPRHEKKFKDRLNDQVSQEVALFNTELRTECRHIEDKIALLNRALANVEYNRGTFMSLEPRRIQDSEIDEFRRALRECLDESLEHSDEANEARFLRIQALVARLADKDRTTWRNKVIDVRNWYDFAAKEIERESGEVRSCYDGSSGQSGGEKAKLAFTILVAALAYQFDVDPTRHAPGRFQFVVVDEMFSKVDDQNAQYALKLFKQFGLQLLIVAPLDAKARVAEPFVDRFLHVVKDAATNRSQIYSMTAREYDEVVLQFAGNGQSGEQRRLTPK